VEFRTAEEKSKQRQTALYSFCGAVVVSFFVVGVWWLTRPTPTQFARQRSLTSVQVTWECPDGTTFVAQGGLHGMPCPDSDRRADVRVTYVCPRHGEHKALVRYVRDDDGRERVSQVSFHRGVWRNVGTYIACPDCGRRMQPKKPNPFEKAPPLHSTQNGTSE
jgi:hypothetical protein